MRKNRTIIKIKGLNQERTINSISNKMKIYNIKRESHNICKFEVDFQKKKELLSLLKDCNMEVLEVHSQGIIWKIKRFFTSYGLIAGIILCSLFYLFQYNYVWKIKIVGEEIINQKEITKFVENKISSRNKWKINTKNIEKQLLENYEEISSVSVAIVGQSLIININETILPEEMQTNNKPIISQFDGMITDITLIQGTLAVDVGDIVQKGDILVYPYIIDSQGEEREVFPKAEIWADIWVSGTEIHYDYQIISQRTGESRTNSQIYLFDKLIYSNAKKCDYLEYEMEKQSSYLNKNNILPFVLTKVTYYEVKTMEIFKDFSTVKDDIIEKARQKALIFLQENEIIKEEKITLKEGGGIHEVDVLLTVNRNIGENNEN